MAKERFIVVVGRVVFGATALMADEAVTQSQQSVHLKARVVAICYVLRNLQSVYKISARRRARDSADFGRLVRGSDENFEQKSQVLQNG